MEKKSKIEKLKTEISEIYGERLDFDHWEELEYSVIDEIGLKVNEIIDHLNSQEQELDKAREEGRREVINELNDLDDVENNDEFGQYKVWAKYLIEQLSKLKTKE